MPAFRLRPATKDDTRAIRTLIRAVRINPIGLDWRRFMVATASHEGVIGCGQIKTHINNAPPFRELASLAVSQDWRGRGIGSVIIENLLATHPGPFYLTCRSSMSSFYQRFGFWTIQAEQMPMRFQRIYRSGRILHNLRIIREQLLVMRREV